MPENPAEAAPVLAELLEKQLAIYGSVLDLSRSQRQLIDSGDTSDLMQLLSEKQKLIAEIESVSAVIAPLQNACEGAGDSIPGEVRERIENALAGLRATLAEIVALEDEGQGSLNVQKQGAGGKLAHLQKGKMMHKAYGGNTKKIPPIARFKDKNG
ncbi:MAG: flagellar export chaperone FlgN [Planctomycetes bacterium]|nr:flagellar export chaperone FlgN [Planctomycetota bacterium]